MGIGEIEFTFALEDDASLAVVRILDVFSGEWLAPLEYDMERVQAGVYTITWDGTLWGDRKLGKLTEGRYHFFHKDL